MRSEVRLVLRPRMTVCKSHRGSNEKCFSPPRCITNYVTKGLSVLQQLSGLVVSPYDVSQRKKTALTQTPGQSPVELKRRSAIAPLISTHKPVGFSCTSVLPALTYVCRRCSIETECLCSCCSATMVICNHWQPCSK